MKDQAYKQYNGVRMSLFLYAVLKKHKAIKKWTANANPLLKGSEYVVSSVGEGFIWIGSPEGQEFWEDVAKDLVVLQNT